MKEPSHRNLLIALGVAVAAIILFTALYFSEGSLSFVPGTRTNAIPKKSSSQVLIKTISSKLIPILSSIKSK